VIICIICLHQVDMKILIAYSSVAHMRFVITTSLSKTNIGIHRRVLIILSHGLVSSGLFLGAFLLYQSSNSRLVLINHRNLQFLPIFSLCWFLLCIANRGGPFTLNLAREVIRISIIINYSNKFIAPVFLIAFLSCAYSVILYIFTQHKSQNFPKKIKSLNIIRAANIASHSVIVYFSIIILFIFQ
jgi:NADH-ubiquinone oxidoreductase chain 4